jgi:hypothetical protein
LCSALGVIPLASSESCWPIPSHAVALTAFSLVDIFPSEVTTSSRSLPWVPAVLAIVFTAAATILLFQYSRLHWRVLFHHGSDLGDEVREQLFTLLAWLHIYRGCAAALAVMCAVWATFSRPRWVGAVALIFALLAV